MYSCASKLLVCFIFSVSTIHHQVNGQICSKEETMKCLETINGIMNYENVPFYGNSKELDERCWSYTSSLKCMEDFSEKCLPTKQRRIMQYFMEGPKKFITNLCREGPYRKSFLSLTSCLISNPDASLLRCTEDFAIYLKGDNSMKVNMTDRPEKERLNQVLKNTCQALKKFYKCGRSIAERHCGKKIADFFEIILLDITKPLVTSSCKSRTTRRNNSKYKYRSNKYVQGYNGGSRPNQYSVLDCVIFTLFIFFGQRKIT